jgi:hypothetical protein
LFEKFDMLPVPCLYICSLMMFIPSNLQLIQHDIV